MSIQQSICSICGANYEYRNGRWLCPACGAYKPEEITNEEMTLIYGADQKLRISEFDEAEGLFDDIVRKYPNNHAGYWGRLRARYGIKYEEDFDGRRIPTCCATSIESFLNDSDYKRAIELADRKTADYYREQAEYIERVRCEWVDKARKEKPYDVFICYKDSDLGHGIQRTDDSIAAQELYIHLQNQGYRVFYSRESLRGKMGEKYEPYIFNALSTAKVMIVFGSSVEYVQSAWVKNEWIRFSKRIAVGEKKENSLVVAYLGFDPKYLPGPLSSKQCIDASKPSFYSDIDAHIYKVINGEEKYAVEEYKRKKKRIVPIILVSLLAAALAIGAAVVGMRYLDNDDSKITDTDAISTDTNETETQKHYGGVPMLEEDKYGVTAQCMYFTDDVSLSVLGIKDSIIAPAVRIIGPKYAGYNIRVNGYDKGDEMKLSIPIPDDMNMERIEVYSFDGNTSTVELIESNVSNKKVSFTTESAGMFVLVERYEHNFYYHNGAVYGYRNDANQEQLSIIIPEQLEEGVNVVRIAEQAFYMNESIRKVVIPDTVRNIETAAFYACVNLMDVTLPSKVNVQGRAFYNCSELRYVYYLGANEQEWTENVKLGSYSENIRSAERFYYSETRPENASGYWCYNSISGLSWPWVMEVENKKSGTFCMDFSRHGGNYAIGTTSSKIVTAWSRRSVDTVWATRGSYTGMVGFAVMQDRFQWPPVIDKSIVFSTTSKAVGVGDIVVWKSESGSYAATRIVSINDSTRSGGQDELIGEYIIY